LTLAVCFELCALGFERSAAASPLSPAEALASFRLEPGLRAELVAAEPAVISPCALAFDERGRMFVAENRGYPLGSPDGRPRGVIALLEDADGDGRFEKRSDFATGLTFPNGVLPWRGGVIVTCAPDVFWLADTNGDGQADVREVWLTGFDDKNTTQLRFSHPTLGPDGWIYLTSGWTGECTVRSPKFPSRPAVKLRTDSRFNPFTGELEAVDGRAQFGQTFDDVGRRFICYNRVHVQHVVGSSRFWKRNPNLAFAETVQNCPEEMVNDLLGSSENRAARLYPVSDNLTTADSHAGTFTAACGVQVYRGDALPGHYGRVFACDPTGNLVHWDDLVPNGATFRARRSTNQTEFLASTDNWFRPVNLATGPDGALYICDMYRQTIEHPQYLPEEIRKRTDFDAGKVMGRIWRVTASSAKAGTSRFTFGTATRRRTPERGLNLLTSGSTKELVAALNHPNSWQRDTAFRLLIERQAREAVPELVKLMPKASRNSREARAGRPGAESDPAGFGPHVTRVAALSAFAVLSSGAQEHDGKFFKIIYPALFDPSPAVREAAWNWLTRLAQPGPDVTDAITRQWADDPSPRIRFLVALAYGNWKGSATVTALAQIARRDGADRWLRAAVLSGVPGRGTDLLEAVMHLTNGAPAVELMGELCRMIGATQPTQDVNTLHQLTRSRQPGDELWQIAGMAGLLEGIRGRANGRAGADGLVLESRQLFHAATSDEFQGWLDRSEAILLDLGQPLPARLAAASLLANASPDAAARVLPAVLRPEEPLALQQEAIKALCGFPGDQAAALLAPTRWGQLTAAARQSLLAAMISQPRHLAGLLAALDSGALPPSAFATAQRNQLLRHRDESIRQRAGKIFQAAGGDRMKVYEQAKSALALRANPAHGRALFATHCASCHRLDRVGAAVGPDLLGTRNQPKETILLHVLVPNAEILPSFAAYQIETRDGRELSGLIFAETASSLTLRQAQGIEETIPRANIRSLTASAVSLMPDGFEQSMKPQDLADLLGYLKGEKE
jgi:putative membrane-bound dehydrogenase-like protein